MCYPSIDHRPQNYEENEADENDTDSSDDDEPESSENGEQYSSYSQRKLNPLSICQKNSATHSFLQLYGDGGTMIAMNPNTPQFLVRYHRIAFNDYAHFINSQHCKLSIPISESE